MEKRIPLALFLCFLLILLFNLMQPPPVPPAPTDAQQVETQEPESAQNTAAELAPDRLAAEAEERLELEFGRAGEPGHYRATFTNLGARLLQLDCGNYRNSKESPLGEGTWVRLLQPVQGREGVTGSLALVTQPSARAIFPEPLESVLWRAEVERDDDGRAHAVHFSYGPGGGWLLHKTVRPVRADDGSGTYVLGVELALERTADSAPHSGSIGLVMTPAACVGIEFPDSFYQQPSAVAVGGADGDLDADTVRAKPNARDLAGPLDVPQPIRAVGAHNKYFAVVMHAVDDVSRAVLAGAAYRRIEDGARVAAEPAVRGKAYDYVVADTFLQLVVPAPGERKAWSFELYAGPKDESHFVDGKVHEEILREDLSTFSGIGRFLTTVLRFLERFLGNWGVAIILLTVLMRLVLFPLNRRAQTAMAQYQSKMKRIQPKLEELKKKHENDPQALRQEQAKLMQKEGAFPPLGGCLPIFLQLPIFFGLFAALRTSFDLRQAPFVGYIDDLSRADQLHEFASAIPILGITHFNLLPILMVVLWILQQKTMPKPTDENARRMQRIMLFMPVVMGVFLYNYAAGLSLYMMTQSTLGIFEQKIIKKFWPVDETEKPRKKRSGCAPLAERMQKLAEEQQKRQAELARQRSPQLRKRKK